MKYEKMTRGEIYEEICKLRDGGGNTVRERAFRMKLEEALTVLMRPEPTIDVIVTRHPGLIDYLRELGVATETTEVVSHATPETVSGKHVCGVLPHNLSCLCLTFTEVPLAIPAELRGKELTLEEVKLYASAPVTYRVEKL